MVTERDLGADELDRDVVDLGDTVDELVFEDDTDLAGDTGMATQELDVETLVDDVEEVAELELEDIAPASRRAASRGSRPAAPAAAAPVRRVSAVSAAVAEAEEEPGWVKACAILTALLLIMAAPIIMSIATGNAGGLAKGVAGIFGATWQDAPPAATAAEE